MDRDGCINLVEFLAGFFSHRVFNAADDSFGLVFPAMNKQPPRAFRYRPADQQDRQPKNESEEEGQTPANISWKQLFVQSNNRQQRSAGGPDPEGPINDDVDAAAIVCRDELIDRRVNRSVLPT